MIDRLTYSSTSNSNSNRVSNTGLLALFLIKRTKRAHTEELSSVIPRAFHLVKGLDAAAPFIAAS